MMSFNPLGLLCGGDSHPPCTCCHRPEDHAHCVGSRCFLLETRSSSGRRQRIGSLAAHAASHGPSDSATCCWRVPFVQGITYSSETPMDVVLFWTSAVDGPAGGGASGRRNRFLMRPSATPGKLATCSRSAALAAAQTVGIVLAEHSPRVITFPARAPGLRQIRCSCEWAQVLQRLRETRPRRHRRQHSRSHFKPPTELARRGRNMRKLVIVISDEQRSNGNRPTIPPGDSPPPPGPPPPKTRFPVYSLGVTAGAPLPNLSVSNLTVPAAFIGIHRPVQNQRAVTKHLARRRSFEYSHPPLRRRQAGLIADGPAPRPGAIGHGPLDHTFLEPGSHALTIKADTIDGLEADNTADRRRHRLAAAARAHRRWPAYPFPGLFYPAAEYLVLAMQAGGRRRIRPIRRH